MWCIWIDCILYIRNGSLTSCEKRIIQSVFWMFGVSFSQVSGFLDSHFETWAKQKVLLALFISGSIPAKQVEFQNPNRGLCLFIFLFCQVDLNALLFYLCVLSLCSFNLLPLRALFRPFSHMWILFYISNFRTGAISELGMKHTCILFLREKLETISIAN